MDAITPRNGWTDERRARLLDLWPDWTLSASAIAYQLGGGLTRNAVLGRANRLIRKGQLKPRLAVPPRKKLIRPGPRPWDIIGISRRAWERRRSLGRPLDAPRQARIANLKAGQRATPPIAIDCSEPDMLRLTIWELTKTTCRWPLDDPPEDNPVQTYCGKRPESGSPYCPYHSRVSYSPTFRSLSEAEHARRRRQAAIWFGS
jgi:GcrA cell cycle regulator